MVLDWMRPLSVLFERFMAFAPFGWIWDTARGWLGGARSPFRDLWPEGVCSLFGLIFDVGRGVSEAASGSGSVLP